MYGKLVMSSVLDSELLASHVNQQLQKQDQRNFPNYLQQEEFQNFIDENSPMIQANEGYMFVVLDKDYYLPGEMVNGSVFFELYNISLQTNLMIKFEGYELVSERLERKIMQNNSIGNNNYDNIMEFSHYENEQSKLLQSTPVRQSNNNQGPPQPQQSPMLEKQYTSKSGQNQNYKDDRSSHAEQQQQQQNGRLSFPDFKIVGNGGKQPSNEYSSKGKEALPPLKLPGKKQNYNSNQPAVRKQNSLAESHKSNRLSGMMGIDQMSNAQDLEIHKMASFVEDQLRNPEDQIVQCWFSQEQKIFRFRGGRVPAGQYEFPFTFTIPHKRDLPSTFQFINKNGENYQVKYSVTVFFDDIEPCLIYSKEINILQLEPEPEIQKKQKVLSRIKKSQGKQVIQDSEMYDDSSLNKPEKYSGNKNKKDLDMLAIAPDTGVGNYNDKINKKSDEIIIYQSSKNKNLMKKMAQQGLGIRNNKTGQILPNIEHPDSTYKLSLINYNCLFCRTQPTEAMVSLNKTVFEPNENIEIFIDFLNMYQYVEVIKASLIVEISVQSYQSDKVYEKISGEIISQSIPKPFRQKESLIFDIKNYNQSVALAKQEYFIQLQNERNELLKNQEMISIQQRKRVNINGYEAPKRPGQVQLKGQDEIQVQQGIKCFDIATCNGQVIKSNFHVEVILQSKSFLFNNQSQKVKIPVSFYMKPKPYESRRNGSDRESLISKQISQDKIEKIRQEFPAAFNPQIMPCSHIIVNEAS